MAELEKDRALYEVQCETDVYELAKHNLNLSRGTFFASIRRARRAGATQQEIANATSLYHATFPGLSRQRIAQILKESE